MVEVLELLLYVLFIMLPVTVHSCLVALGLITERAQKKRAKDSNAESCNIETEKDDKQLKSIIIVSNIAMVLSIISPLIVLISLSNGFSARIQSMEPVPNELRNFLFFVLVNIFILIPVAIVIIFVVSLVLRQHKKYILALRIQFVPIILILITIIIFFITWRGGI